MGIVLALIEGLAPKNIRPFVPSSMGLGLAMVVPFANALSFFIGAVIAEVVANSPAARAGLQPGDIVLNEAIRNGPVVFAQMPRTEPGSLVGLAGGGLGFSGGMALGLKLAQPERNVVQVVGDGTFYFSNPQSTLAVGKQYRLPVLTVVLDNTGWAAVKEATLRVYPEGEAKAAATRRERMPANHPHVPSDWPSVRAQ